MSSSDSSTSSLSCSSSNILVNGDVSNEKSETQKIIEEFLPKYEKEIAEFISKFNPDIVCMNGIGIEQSDLKLHDSAIKEFDSIPVTHRNYVIYAEGEEKSINTARELWSYYKQYKEQNGSSLNRKCLEGNNIFGKDLVALHSYNNDGDQITIGVLGLSLFVRWLTVVDGDIYKKTYIKYFAISKFDGDNDNQEIEKKIETKNK